jgi:hypothetical protein
MEALLNIHIQKGESLEPRKEDSGIRDREPWDKEVSGFSRIVGANCKLRHIVPITFSSLFAP